MCPFMNPILNLFSFFSYPIHRDRSSQPWPTHTHREDQTGLWAAHFHRLVPGLGPWLLEHWPPGAGHGGAGDLNFELKPLTFKPHCLTASWSKLPLDTYKMPIRCLSGFNHSKKTKLVLGQYQNAIFTKSTLLLRASVTKLKATPLIIFFLCSTKFWRLLKLLDCCVWSAHLMMLKCVSLYKKIYRDIIVKIRLTYFCLPFL